MKSSLTGVPASHDAGIPVTDSHATQPEPDHGAPSTNANPGLLSGLGVLRRAFAGGSGAKPATADATGNTGQRARVPAELLHQIAASGGAETRRAMRPVSRQFHAIAEDQTTQRRLTSSTHLRKVAQAIDQGRYPKLSHLDASGLELRAPSSRRSLAAPFGEAPLPALGKLEKLDLQENGKLGSQGLIQLIGDGAQLRELNAAGTGAGDAGALHLANLPQLRKLGYGDMRLTIAGVRALAAHPGLESLALGNSPGVGHEGAQVLASNSRLRELTLDNCAIGNRGAEALAGMTGLQRLRLPDNDIGDRGALALAANPRLLHLDLRGNSGISQPVRRQLAEQARATGRVILV
ncbi:hypothetical protein WJ59_31450 [Burkholderia gladioli]|uniref:hypothetical protein n=1 Tax=Burkholderia gladioli TaxID=28095 RepID=UPI00075A9135|nr:hypothetical protein [Burkholderia gladioli]KVM59407.1 hypothetical protein WJ59_31450 [Burkholderia gladioli]